MAEDNMRNNVGRLYMIVWSQSSHSVRTKVEAMDEFANVKTTKDGLGLLRVVRRVMLNYQDRKFAPMAGYDTRKMQFCVQQQPHQALREYYDTFKSLTSMLKNIGAEILPMTTTVDLIQGDQLDPNADKDATLASAMECEVACAFLRGAYQTQYGAVLSWLHNQYMCGNDNYPRNITDAYTLLAGWQRNQPEWGAVPTASCSHMWARKQPTGQRLPPPAK
jgi:hypothetical protein